MSVFSDSYRQSEGPQPGPHGYAGCGAGWKPIEIVAMVLGFIVFWPIGLAILFAKLWQKKHGYQGDIPSFVEAKLREKWNGTWSEKWPENWPAKFQEKWEAKMGHWACQARHSAPRHWEFRASRSTGNAAFDEWRETELARLEEERQKLLAAERDFAEFIDTLRRAKDREDFERFMAARRNRGTEPPAPPPGA